jgi:hypothetical protein
MKSDSISKANATCQQKGIDAVFHQFLGRINLKRFEIGFWFLRLIKNIKRINNNDENDIIEPMLFDQAVTYKA